MDWSPLFSSCDNSDGDFYYLEEDPRPSDPPIAEAPSESETTHPRISVQPYRSLLSTEQSVRLLNAYFSIYYPTYYRYTPT